MFKNTYQNGLLSIFYSCGSNPLAIWDMEVKNGHIKRLTDTEVNSIVLEIVSTNVATTFITCPRQNQVLGIKLPFLVMIVKNLKRYFSFEITILDDKNMRRRFRISNFQSTTKIKPFCTTMPIGLAGGWNQVQFNLADFTRRAYGTQYIEALRVQVHANARLRRIYFCERLYGEEELPNDYKLFLPMDRKKKPKLEKKEEVIAAIPPPSAVSAPPLEAASEPPKEEPLPQAPAEELVAVTEKPAAAEEEKPVEVIEGTAEPESEITEEAPAEGPGDTEGPVKTPGEEAETPAESDIGGETPEPPVEADAVDEVPDAE